MIKKQVACKDQSGTGNEDEGVPSEFKFSEVVL